MSEKIRRPPAFIGDHNLSLLQAKTSSYAALIERGTPSSDGSPGDVASFVQQAAQNAQLETLWQVVADLAETIVETTILRGNEPMQVSLSSGVNQVEHKLGRQPVGWWVIDRDSAATVHRTDWDDRILTLQASAGVNVKLVVV